MIFVCCAFGTITDTLEMTTFKHEQLRTQHRTLHAFANPKHVLACVKIGASNILFCV